MLLIVCGTAAAAAGAQQQRLAKMRPITRSFPLSSARSQSSQSSQSSLSPLTLLLLLGQLKGDGGMLLDELCQVTQGPAALIRHRLCALASREEDEGGEALWGGKGAGGGARGPVEEALRSIHLLYSLVYQTAE